jgi:uncharacterized protein (TIGR03437 family)
MWAALAILSAALPSLFAQGVTAIGYAPPSSVTSIAPGQILTLFVAGVQPNTSAAIAASTIPMPTTLAGLTVQFSQPTGMVQNTHPVPILAVVPNASPCPPSAATGCTLTWVTVQIPYELGATLPGEFEFAESAVVFVSDGTRASTPVQLSPIYDQIHILNDDTIRASLNAASGQAPSSGGPAVTHVDGSPVTASNPASAGETLVMYAVGLGVVGPGIYGAVTAGQASPSSPATRTGLAMQYNYTANLPPSRPAHFPNINATDPTIQFAGLTPGLVGLWQINFTVPAPPAPLARCGAPGIMSNLTVTLSGTYSFDGVGICVTGPAQ